jgi:hypothetical protein
MKKKQTAVEWLALYIKGITSLNCDEVIEQAKAMEKEQMNKASKDLWCEACDYWMNVKTNIKSL